MSSLRLSLRTDSHGGCCLEIVAVQTAWYLISADLKNQYANGLLVWGERGKLVAWLFWLMTSGLLTIVKDGDYRVGPAC